MNRVLLLLPERWFSLANFHGFLKDIPLKEFFLAGLSAGLIAFQLVLVYFILDDRSLVHAFQALMMLYLISPQFHYTYDWCMLFYFDFKKLIDPTLGNFQKNYTRNIIYTALLMAFCLFLLSVLLLLFTFGKSALPIVFSLFFIYLLRSLYSIKAIEAFCEFNYGITIVSGGVVAIILLLFYFFESDHP